MITHLYNYFNRHAGKNQGGIRPFEKKITVCGNGFPKTAGNGLYAAPSGIGLMTLLYSLENRISVVISEAISAMGKANQTRWSLPV